MPAPSEITVPQLVRMIGLPDAPVIVDVCLDEDFAGDPYLIPSALRHPFNDFTGLVARLSGQKSVIVCQKGKKLSQGVSALLRAEGMQSEYLQGGMYAWRDHRDAPRIPAKAIPAPVGSSTLWVTRHRPKIDRIACPWLIRRFVDRDARFLFVAPGEVETVAERFGAIPFDVENVFWSHRGENCTFDVMLDCFELRTEALDRLSQVIRAADTNRHESAPQAAGLLAISVGLSRQFKDDNTQLEAGMALYDALYRWARDGSNEGHNWPTAGS